MSGPKSTQQRILQLISLDKLGITLSRCGCRMGRVLNRWISEFTSPIFKLTNLTVMCAWFKMAQSTEQSNTYTEGCNTNMEPISYA